MGGEKRTCLFISGFGGVSIDCRRAAFLEGGREGREMDSCINLKNVSAEELKSIDLDRVSVDYSPPDLEPQRQYYFMAKCRRAVTSESERLGRPLTYSMTTFGCPVR